MTVIRNLITIIIDDHHSISLLIVIIITYHLSRRGGMLNAVNYNNGEFGGDENN